RISRSDWRSIARILEERLGEAKVKELDPYGSSFYCSRCGGRQRPEWGGFRVWWVRSPNRQLNAAINLYMSMSFGYTEKWVGGRKRVQLKMEDASQMVGPRGASKPCGWVRPDRGGAE
ncbi:hypothetical protein B9Q02_01245, partial [Candidatus Marsarchaeota G1 archaeon BE_D]